MIRIVDRKAVLTTISRFFRLRISDYSCREGFWTGDGSRGAEEACLRLPRGGLAHGHDILTPVDQHRGARRRSKDVTPIITSQGGSSPSGCYNLRQHERIQERIGSCVGVRSAINAPPRAPHPISQQRLERNVYQASPCRSLFSLTSAYI